MRRTFYLLVIFLLGVHSLWARQIRFVFISDLHYGLERQFNGKRVSADLVNRAMADAVRALPECIFPDDGALGAGDSVGRLDFIVCGGDIANRMEEGVQTAAESWRQFSLTWLVPQMPQIWLLPGNHDISNAIGYTWPMEPEKDATCAARIYDMTMNPDEPVKADTFDYSTDRVVYTFVESGIRFAFVGIWPDSKARSRLAETLGEDPDTPCILFTHMPPETEAQRFTNPYGDHSINRADGFENLICDTCSVDADGVPVKEYRDLEGFLKQHASLKAWFHGHTNYNEYYIWHGPDNTISLPVFRVDSPMKGEYSETDDTLLSFQVVCLDTETLDMSVREYYWNVTDDNWGETASIRL